MENIEGVGAKFNLDKYLQAQALCRAAVEKIAAQVSLGMNEKDGVALTKSEFQKVGVKKFWHPTKFRIAEDTLKNFSAPSDQDLKITPGEIYYIDVGPVIEDHEADYGKPFVFPATKAGGPSYLSMAEASIQIWNKVAQIFKEERLTGPELLYRSQIEAKALGFELNPAMAGHRLGDFPHALFSKTKLFQYGKVPTPNLWVLEIHLLDRALHRGAFFEDIL